MTDYLPYHFYPFGGDNDGALTPFGSDPALAAENLANPAKLRGTRLTHARYAEGTHSGRIICTIDVLTPLVMGNARSEIAGGRKKTSKKTGVTSYDDYSLVEPFTFNGTLGISGPSLRGMISSFVEATTASAMRVLGRDYANKLGLPGDPGNRHTPYNTGDIGSAVPDCERVPFHAGRTRLTVAEAMFGFVSEEAEGIESVTAYASRIKISAALPKNAGDVRKLNANLPTILRSVAPQTCKWLRLGWEIAFACRSLARPALQRSACISMKL